jgi:hypothetical protein
MKVIDFAITGAKTASGSSAAHNLGDTGMLALRAELNVTAASGTTPTLDVVLEDSIDGTNWNTIGTFSQKTAVAREVLNIQTPFFARLRARYTIGGTTPSFTFDVKAQPIGE